MIVAEVHITIAEFGIHSAVTYTIRFGNLAEAEAEYQRVAALMIRREDKANDLIEVTGSGMRVTVALGDVHSIALCDFALLNKQTAGTADAFPHLFKR